MIRIENLSYWYPRIENPTLCDVNLRIEDGEFVLILGASGSGKSTLLLALNGILQHEIGGKIKGRIEVNRKDPTTSEVCEMAKIISLVMQDPETQLTQMTVWDEVVFGPENLKRPVDEIVENAKRALEFVGLYDKRDQIVSELSGGQKQRLAIAAALAMNSDIIAMDEPTAHLDPRGTREVFEVIRKLKNLEKTLILIEHKLDDIVELLLDDNDRVIVIDEGRIVLNGSPREVFGLHGRYILDNLGLSLPQVVEASIRMNIKPIPIRLSEVDFSKFNIKSNNLERKKVEGNPIIVVEGLEFSYGNGNVLENVSFTIPQGLTSVIVGQNGSGKSTLLQNLIGLLKPTRGRILYNGVDLSSLDKKSIFRDIGYVFQYPEHQFVTKTVKDEIEYGLKIRNLDRGTIERKVKEFLEMFGLEKTVDRHPLTLSMGEKRRLSFATMLILEPRILIMDEPVIGQDKRRTEYLIKLIEQLKSKGVTIIIATHDMNFVARCADHVIVLNDGQVIFQGSAVELFNNNRLLSIAGLDDPPIHKLATQLGFPDIITVEQFCTILAKQVIK
ncbi:MAG: energy-coupling factor transporter ATPase [Candidatus Aenigmatarchaeota archaeon]